MLTPFGQIVRKKRIDKFLTLKEMADALGVSSAFLSAVEMGRKAIPDDWGLKISDYLDLSAEEKKELFEAVEVSKKTIKIDLGGLSPKFRETAFSFARKFPDLSDEDADLLRDFLKNMDGKKK